MNYCAGVQRASDNRVSPATHPAFTIAHKGALVAQELALATPLAFHRAASYIIQTHKYLTEN